MRPPQPPEQEIYNPRPLEELDDQEAMAASGVMAAPKKPVYIINREDLNLYHPYYVNFKNPGRWQRASSNNLAVQYKPPIMSQFDLTIL